MEVVNDVELPSNETEVDSISSDWKSTTFEETPLISSYLMGLTITDFTHVEAKTKSGTTVRVWARPEATEAGITKYSLTKAVEAFDFLEDYYQTPQPMKKQGLSRLNFKCYTRLQTYLPSPILSQALWRIQEF